MKKKYILLLIIASLLFFFLGIFIGKKFNKDNNSFTITRSPGKQLTNPLLDFEIYEKSPHTKVNQMKKKINDLIDTYQEDLNEVSVFFRDLNNGPSFGINENNKFSPASLLKVPLMMTYLKQSESQPDLLSRKLKFEGNLQLRQNLPEKDTLTPGSFYTVDNLIYRMISLSDNLAFELLLQNLDTKLLQNLHRELDLIYPDNTTPEDYISVKSYAGLFRILYNSTYLNRAMSEKALDYLTKSDFHLGIQAGIPKNVTSALKFGLRETDQNGVMQIHDCGIIYNPDKPYLLCVMTKGENRDKLIEVIKNISGLIYKQIQESN